jgi:DMSO/TMAO reductase YedYZ molybdopterin-dependent catalytic subunit
MLAVGGAFVDRTPRWLKDFAVREFGSRDKDVLLSGVLATVLLLAALLGVLAVRRPRAAYAGVAGLSVVAAVAALSRPTATWVDIVPSVVVGIFGVLALAAVRGAAVHTPERADLRPQLQRRSFLVASAAALAAAAGADFVGRRLTARNNVAAERSTLQLPRPASPAPTLPPRGQLEVAGITPFFTQPRDFYRVDTTLSVPELSAADWQLRLHGDVAHPLTLRWADLLAMPMIERDITLTCVSNTVGGGLAGNARWLGVPVRDLLDRVQPGAGAEQVVCRSVDGMTIGTPTAALRDGRDAILAVGMDGAPLPPAHGYPVRMVVPGLFGYVSATKWLVDMEFTTFDAYDAYWVQRGWAQQGEILTASRIDTPKSQTTKPAGDIVVAGVAWAQHRGISRVEVRVDGGTWHEAQAQLAQSSTRDTWRQWVWQWTGAPPGRHTLQVRATDGTGAVQPEQRADPFPRGATGWHTVSVGVGS